MLAVAQVLARESELRTREEKLVETSRKAEEKASTAAAMERDLRSREESLRALEAETTKREKEVHLVGVFLSLTPRVFNL